MQNMRELDYQTNRDTLEFVVAAEYENTDGQPTAFAAGTGSAKPCSRRR